MVKKDIKKPFKEKSEKKGGRIKSRRGDDGGGGEVET